jgi:hypothetical protein
VPLVLDEEEEPPFETASVPFAGGNMDGRACEGAGVDGDVITGFWGETAGKGTLWDAESSTPSPTRRLFVSVFAGDNLIVGGGDLVPKDGD